MSFLGKIKCIFYDFLSAFFSEVNKVLRTQTLQLNFHREILKPSRMF